MYTSRGGRGDHYRQANDRGYNDSNNNNPVGSQKYLKNIEKKVPRQQSPKV